MTKGIIRTLLLAAVMLLAVPLPGQAQKVVATGVGPSREAAIREASRNAVEQAVGSCLSSRTEVSGGRLDMDRITSSISAYVRGYDVLAEGKDPIDDVYKVKLEVEVDDHKVQDAVTEFLDDPRFQKTFQRNQFDQRRVLVLYNRRTSNDPGYHTQGVQTLMDRVQDRLAGYGFRVFLPEELARIRENTIDTMVDQEAALRLARLEKAEAVVVASIDSGALKTDDGLLVVRATISIKAYDATTGELFATVQDRGKTMAHADGFSLEDGVAKIAIDAGGRASDSLTKKIVKRFSLNREKFVVLAFTNVNADVQHGAEKLLRTLGWDYRLARQSDEYLEVEVFTSLSPQDAAWEFEEAARNDGLPVERASSSGSRLIFNRR